jgi:hypothetical protein
MRLKSWLSGAICLAVTANGMAQTFSPFVKRFVKMEADTFALENVEMIDGTGGL